MNTLPEPKSIELSRKGWAVLLPNGDFSLHQCGEGMYVYGKFGGEWAGCRLGVTYRIKCSEAPLPTPKAKEEPLRDGSVQQAMQDHHNDLVGRRHTAAFLRSCRHIVLQDPMQEWEPFGKEIPLIGLTYGKLAGHGEINPDGEYESYLDGKTFKVKNIVSITP